MRKEVTKMNDDATVSVRDYEVNSCVIKNENMEIIHNSDKMTLTPEQLENICIRISAKLKSKIANGKDYRLYSYAWNPDEIEL